MKNPIIFLAELLFHRVICVKNRWNSGFSNCSRYFSGKKRLRHHSNKYNILGFDIKYSYK